MFIFFRLFSYKAILRVLFTISCAGSAALGTCGFCHHGSSACFFFSSFIQNLCFLLGSQMLPVNVCDCYAGSSSWLSRDLPILPLPKWSCGHGDVDLHFLVPGSTASLCTKSGLGSSILSSL